MKNKYDTEPGHYYSSIASIDEIKARENQIWKGVNIDGVEGINLDLKEQTKLLTAFKKYYKDIPFGDNKTKDLRFYFRNDFFGHGDSITLYSFMRHFKPKKIIEVGSGYSSAVMLDTRKYFFTDNLKLIFIEPYPERLYTLMTDADHKTSEVAVNIVQNIETAQFQQLEKNDILFIDSSHVSKVGSDVNHIIFDILPSLKSGVIIHFHDIFYPFEYPKDWVFGGRNWSEDYILKAFLMNNSAYKILFWGNYLLTHHRKLFADMPLFYENEGCSFWMQKI